MTIAQSGAIAQRVVVLFRVPKCLHVVLSVVHHRHYIWIEPTQDYSHARRWEYIRTSRLILLWLESQLGISLKVRFPLLCTKFLVHVGTFPWWLLALGLVVEVEKRVRLGYYPCSRGTSSSVGYENLLLCEIIGGSLSTVGVKGSLLLNLGAILNYRLFRRLIKCAVMLVVMLHLWTLDSIAYMGEGTFLIWIVTRNVVIQKLLHQQVVVVFTIIFIEF